MSNKDKIRDLDYILSKGRSWIEEENKRYEAQSTEEDGKLTFDKFIRMPREQQIEEYKNLSNHDKFLARMNFW